MLPVVLDDVQKRKFNPLDLINSELWLSAINVVADDADPIQNWDDLSPNDNDGQQPTEANRALYKTGILNGRSVMRFDGANDSYNLSSTISLTGDFTVIALWEIVIEDIILGHDDQGNYFNPFAANKWNTKNATANVTYDMPFTAGAFAIVATIRTSGTITVRKDGVQTDSKAHAGTFTFNRVGERGGGLAYLNGDMPEMIIYSDAKAGTDLAKLENYFGSYYGIGLG